jgi:hypothetical protein
VSSRSDARAERTDPSTGIREVADYFGPGDAIFGFAHLPDGDAEECVVVCSGLHGAAFKNYRREVELGRALATRGIAVQRFHYRGEGNSTGAETDTTIASMCEDATLATERILSLCTARRVGFFGVTLGAIVAVNLAGGYEGAPIALWDPVLEGRRYFRNLIRAQRIIAMNQGGRDVAAPADGGGDVISVAGYSISRKLYESVMSVRLVENLGIAPRPILLLTFGERRAGGAKEEAAASWRTHGFVVDEHSIEGREAWWFTAGPHVAAEMRDDASTVTADWLSGALDAKRR